MGKFYEPDDERKSFCFFSWLFDWLHYKVNKNIVVVLYMRNSIWQKNGI